MSESDAGKDYYGLLGARDDAPRDEIGRRYKRLAAEHHPDRGGSEEQMKELNEAYRVLADEAARAAYDERRRAHRASGADKESTDGESTDVGPDAAASGVEWFAREMSAQAGPRGAQADAVWGRVAGAGLTIFAGLVLLLLVRTHYVVFLFPLALLAAGLVLFGVWMAHAALAFAREGLAPTHFARRTVWAQEIAFWALVACGVCGLYLLLTAF